MGTVGLNSHSNNMKAFIISTLMAAASAAPLLGHHGLHSPVLAHGVHAPVLGHGVHAPVLGHGVHSPLVAHGVHAPVVSHAVHAPVVAHHAAHHAGPAYDTPSPYTYSYAVSDDYSKANFNAAESSDGAGNAEGSYSVALPDGRIQHVNYHANDYDGYVADVTYEGAPQYPEYQPAAPAYHGPAVAHPVAHHALHAPVHHVAAPAVVGHHGLAGHGVALLG